MISDRDRDRSKEAEMDTWRPGKTVMSHEQMLRGLNEQRRERGLAPLTLEDVQRAERQRQEEDKASEDGNPGPTTR